MIVWDRLKVVRVDATGRTITEWFHDVDGDLDTCAREVLDLYPNSVIEIKLV